MSNEQPTVLSNRKAATAAAAAVAGKAPKPAKVNKTFTDNEVTNLVKYVIKNFAVALFASKLLDACKETLDFDFPENYAPTAFLTKWREMRRHMQEGAEAFKVEASVFAEGSDEWDFPNGMVLKPHNKLFSANDSHHVQEQHCDLERC